MAVVGLDHVQLAMPAGAEAEATAYYEGLLGLTQIPKPEPLASRGGCWFAHGSVQVHLGVEAPFRPAKKAHPAFLVDDLAALCARLEAAGLSFAGLSPDGLLPETVEYPDHPWFIGVQFHPELKSRPFDPHPLFKSFIAAAVEQSRLV